MRFSTLAATVALVIAFGGLVSAADKPAKSAKESKWEEVKSIGGKITSTIHQTGGNNNVNRGNNGKYANTSNYIEKPEYVPFEISGNGLRIKYETKSTGDRSDLRMELEKEITKPNGDKDWQRVGMIARARGGGEGGKAFTTGAGNYRIELTGQNMEYKFVIEQPIKK